MLSIASSPDCVCISSGRRTYDNKFSPYVLFMNSSIFHCHCVHFYLWHLNRCVVYRVYALAISNEESEPFRELVMVHDHRIVQPHLLHELLCCFDCLTPSGTGSVKLTLNLSVVHRIAVRLLPLSNQAFY